MDIFVQNNETISNDNVWIVLFSKQKFDFELGSCQWEQVDISMDIFVS